jgi:hypothetical protein
MSDFKRDRVIRVKIGGTVLSMRLSELVELNIVKPPSKQPKPINPPRESLQHLARQLGKSARQIRRYCELGLVPGAERTPGGHWRVRTTPEILRKALSAITPFTRGPKRLERSRKVRKCLLASLEPDYDELPVKLEWLLKYDKATNGKGYRLARLYQAINELQKASAREHSSDGLKLTGSDVAQYIGISRSTLYNWFPKGQFRRAFQELQAATIGKYQKAFGLSPQTYKKNRNLQKTDDCDDDVEIDEVI